jgi:RNA polymerase sigma-70 factor (ECF subfamily)
VAGAGDAELVELVRAGHPSAFATLYRAHAPAVYRVARERVPVVEAATDVVQETFARALASLDKLREPDRFRPWILSIARHAAIDDRRSRSRLTPLGDESAGALPSDDRGPEEVAELAELAELLEVCVGDLSPRDATAVYLVTHLGLSPAEVGAALGISPGAAKVVVHRARRRLRDALALRLMVRHRGTSCARFSELHDGGQIVQAARHLRECPICDRAVATEVHLYEAGRTVSAHRAPAISIRDRSH